MKQRCKSHGTLMFDELYILAKYKYLSLKKWIYIYIFPTW
jgi:hypothetical protein